MKFLCEKYTCLLVKILGRSPFFLLGMQAANCGYQCELPTLDLPTPRLPLLIFTKLWRKIQKPLLQVLSGPPLVKRPNFISFSGLKLAQTYHACTWDLRCSPNLALHHSYINLGLLLKNICITGKYQVSVIINW